MRIKMNHAHKGELMARISLYITDELKERMDAAGDEVNWSDVARPSLTAAVADFEHRKTGTMHTAIERLRASRKKREESDTELGTKAGRAWAADDAEYRELKELHYRRTKYPDQDPTEALEFAIDPNHEMQGPELWDRCRVVIEPPSDEFMKAFVEAAVNLFLEIRKEVERD
jgi:hypothetical protein